MQANNTNYLLKKVLITSCLKLTKRVTTIAGQTFWCDKQSSPNLCFLDCDEIVHKLRDDCHEGIAWVCLKLDGFHWKRHYFIMRNRGGERGFQCLWTWIQNWFQILLSYCFIAHDPKSYSSTGLWFPEDVIDSEPTFPHKALHWMALNCQEIVLLRMPNHVIDIASAELFETFLAKWSALILRDPYYPVKFTHPNQVRFNSCFLSRLITNHCQFRFKLYNSCG